MIRKLAVLLALLPIAAFAQGAAPAPKGAAGGPSDEKMEKMVKRARLARNLGLAEALDLDTAQATRLADSLAKLDDKRVALHKQQHEAHQFLRRAAQGEKVSVADVDGALAKIFDVRTQLTALDKETLAVVTKDLSPEKKARAALFLARFQERMGHRMRGGMGPGMHGGMGHEMGGGMGPGMGGGMMGPGMGGGMMGPDRGGEHEMAAGSCPNCSWEDEDE